MSEDVSDGNGISIVFMSEMRLRGEKLIQVGQEMIDLADRIESEVGVSTSNTPARGYTSRGRKKSDKSIRAFAEKFFESNEEFTSKEYMEHLSMYFKIQSSIRTELQLSERKGLVKRIGYGVYRSLIFTEDAEPEEE